MYLLKKIIIPLFPMLILGAGTSLVYTSCATKTETQIMLDFYESKSEEKKVSVFDNASYYKLWTDLTKSSTSLYDTPEINWCLEYSLYLPFLFQDGMTLIQTDTLAIKLNDIDSLWNLYKAGQLQLQFLRGLSNVIETDGSLQLTYTGYLHLNVNSTINLIETNDSTNDDYQLNKGSIIEILFAFANCSFTEADITAPIQSNDWWSQQIKVTAPFIGDQLGTISFYNSDQARIASSGIQSAPTINKANYFGAYKS